MSTTQAPPATKPALRWWRRLLQFNLRTLLLLTLLASLVCVWYLAPPTHTRHLACGFTVWSETRVAAQLVAEQRSAAGLTTAASGAAAPDLTMQYAVEHGRWELRDTRGRLVLRGRMNHGEPHGTWTRFHSNGKPAAQGPVAFGCRTGEWQEWNSDGHLVAKMAFAPPRECDRTLFGYEQQNSPDPFGFPTPLFARARLLPAAINSQGIGEIVERRHGPAHWYWSGGQLQEEGAYEGGAPTGLWVAYFATGEVQRQGRYLRGAPQGDWQWHAEPGAPARETFFALGQPVANPAAAAEGAAARLASPHSQVRSEAIGRLVRLESYGSKPLLEMLAAGNSRAAAEVLFAAIEFGHLTPELALAAQRWEDSSEPVVRYLARAATILASQGEQNSRWAELCEAASSGDHTHRAAAVQALRPLQGQTFDYLRGQLASPAADTRLAALEVLVAVFGGPSYQGTSELEWAYLALLEALNHDPDERVARRALEARQRNIPIHYGSPIPVVGSAVFPGGPGF